ncbi:hypothetical protein P7C70_g8341, partial [Phenoliferia sp. Uapishka_3]
MTSPSTSRTYSTLRSFLYAPATSPSIPGAWAETVPSRAPSSSKDKGKRRGAIPVWGGEDEDENVVEVGFKDEEKGREREERDREERELTECAERIVYQLVLTIFSTTLLSGKTAKRKKIVQCSSLSSLAREMGAEVFVRIEFPPEVYVENSLVESAIHLPFSSRLPPKLFGEELDLVMGEEGEVGLPRVVKDCIGVLMVEGPSSIGIFRRSPSSAMVKQIQDAYDRGHPVTLSQYPDSAYVAASLLKLYLR